MNKNNSVDNSKTDLSVVSDEEKNANQKPKINYEMTRTPKQTTVNFNRVVSSSPKRKNDNSNGAKSVGLSDKQKMLIAKAYVTRQKQDNIMLGDVKAKIANNVVLEAKASYYEALAKYKDKRVTLTPSMKDTFKSAGKESVNAIKNAFASQDDVGSQTVGGVITATVTTAKALSTTKRATSAVKSFVKNSPQTVKNAKEKIVKVGNKAYQICGTADKMYLTVKQSLPFLKSGFIPMKTVLVANAIKNGLNKTANIQRIIKLTKKIKQTYQTVKKVAKDVKKVYKYTIKVVKTVAIDLKLKGNLTRGILTQAKNKAKPFVFKAKVQSLKALNKTSKTVTNTAVKGGAWTVTKGIPKGLKGAGKVIGSVSGAMASSDNEMIRGVGHATTIVRYTVKATAIANKYTAKFVKTSPTKINNGVKKVKTATQKTISTATKTAKGVVTATQKTISTATKTTYNGLKYARNHGLKATLKKTKDKAKEKAAKATAEAGKSVVNFVVNLAKKAFGKMLIPVIVGALLIGVIGGAMSGAGGVASYYLSGEFILRFFRGGDEDNNTSVQETTTTTDIKEYLVNGEKGIDYQKNVYISSVSNTISSFLKEKGGSYDKIMLSTESGLSTTHKQIIKASKVEDELKKIFWDNEALYEIIQPLFYVRILVECDLQPTEEEAEKILAEIVNSLFELEQSEGIPESCNALHSCGYVHAKNDCINKTEIIHEKFVCDECCGITCKGHKNYVCSKANIYNHTCNDDCKFKIVVEYCLGCEFSECNGAEICEGHSLYYCNISLNEMDNFITEYFDKPIAELEAKGNERTPEENQKLLMLKDYVEIAKEFIKTSSR